MPEQNPAPIIPPPPPVQHPTDIFYEAQTRLGTATHAIAHQARQIAAARALRLPEAELDVLFQELEVLILVENRERAELAGAHAGLAEMLRGIAPAVQEGA